MSSSRILSFFWGSSIDKLQFQGYSLYNERNYVSTLLVLASEVCFAIFDKKDWYIKRRAVLGSFFVV